MENPFLRKLAMRLFILAIICGAYSLGTHHITAQYNIDDLNKDGKVNVLDFSLFLEHYPGHVKQETQNNQKIEVQLQP